MSPIIELYKRAEGASNRQEALRILVEAELLRVLKSSN